MALEQALDFIKTQSKDLSKYLTKEHHKMVDSFTLIKAETSAKILRLQELED